MIRAPRWLEDGWERLLGADPGQLRVWFALRLALVASLTVMGLVGINYWGTMPIGGIGLGFILAQFSAVAVRDRTRGGQVVSTVISALAALFGAALGSLVGPYPIGSDVVLVMLVIAATAIRPVGPRAMAAGILAFIGFYINLIIHVPLGQLPLDVAAVSYTIVVVLLVRLVILPDRPRTAVPRVLGSVRWQAARVLETVREMILRGGTGRKWSERLVRRNARLEEAIEAAEDQIQQFGGKSAEEGWNRLSETIVELQVQVQRITRLCSAGDPLPRTSPVTGQLARASAALGLQPRDPQRPAPHCSGGAVAGGRMAEIDDAFDRLSAIVAKLPRESPAVLAAAQEPVSAEADDAGQAEASGQDAPKQPFWSRLLPTVRQPIQVGVATGLAIAAGHAVSGRRWYWSVLAVFIVFLGTTSRATTLTKAAQRVLGTLLGAGVGILVAEAVHGQPKLIVALALLADTFAFYAFQTAYSVMIFWITIMIALLFSLLGFFRPELLALRFDETAVGAISGIVVAVLLLPHRTSDAVRTAGLDFLQAVHGALDSLPAATQRAAQAGKSRKVARAIQGLRAAAGPLGRGWVAVTSLEIRLAVQAAMATSYWMHEVAIRLRDHAPADVPPQFGPGLEDLKVAVEKVRQAIGEGQEPPRVRLQFDDAARAPALADLAALAAAIDRYAQALDRVTRQRRKRTLPWKQ